MSSSLQILKTGLRDEIRARMDGVSVAARKEASARALALLERQRVWQSAGSVMLYAPMLAELNVWPLAESALKAGKVLTLPRFDSETNRYVACKVKDLATEVEPGHYGIREPGLRCEPVPLKQLDFMLVPGVAFDLHGRRLGRGKGYYDQLLTAARGTTCGVAFDEQIVREVPVGPHDSDVNCILTPTRWIEL